MINSINDKILQKFKKFNFGKFGIAELGKIGELNKTSLNFDFNGVDGLNGELNTNFSEDEAVAYIIDMLQKWEDIIIRNNNYFINRYLIAMVCETKSGYDAFWRAYIIDPKLDEKKCMSIFQNKTNKKFMDSIDKYLQIGTKLDFGKVIKRDFQFFDYDKFLNSIQIEGLTLDANGWIIIELSDKNHSAYDNSFAVFDQNLNLLDWHNF